MPALPLGVLGGVAPRDAREAVPRRVLQRVIKRVWRACRVQRDVHFV